MSSAGPAVKRPPQVACDDGADMGGISPAAQHVGKKNNGPFRLAPAKRHDKVGL